MRILRALFEVVLRKNWVIMSGRLLNLCKVVEHQLWDWESPLRQFSELGHEILNKIEARDLSVQKIKELDHKEIGSYKTN